MSSPTPEAVPPGVVGTPQGDVVALGANTTQDYGRLVFSAPRFEVIAIADIIQPSVMEACQALLPSLVPPYTAQAAQDAVNALAVRRVGDTMTGALNLNPVIPTANAMAASKQYVDTQIGTVIPEVPPVPAGQAWARELGQWIPLAGGGTVTNIATGAGLTGGPITATGTISMANMVANSLKGNNTGAVAAPTDIPAGTVLTMIGAAPLNSPNFTGAPTLPTGTTGITQPGGTSNTSLATTAFVAGSLGSYAPIASPVFTGAPSLPAGAFGVTAAPGDADTSLATTAFVANAITTATGAYLPLMGGRLSGGLASGPAAQTVPGLGALTLNANTVAPLHPRVGDSLYIIGADGSGTNLGIDSYGLTGGNIFQRHARGTAAAPAASQTNDILGTFGAFGYGATNWGAFNTIQYIAHQTWTDTAQGSQLSLQTTPDGTTTPVNSLILQGNIATFSGNVVLGGFGNQLQWGSAANGYLTTSSTELDYIAPSGPTTNVHRWFAQTPGLTSLMTVDGTGNLAIIGNTATKPGSTSWVNPSERSLKQDIQPYTGSLGDLLDLTPVTYRYTAESGFDSAQTHVGLIHDETAHMPEMHRTVTIGGGMDEPGHEVDALDCGALTFAIINALKELSTRLTTLEGRA